MALEEVRKALGGIIAHFIQRRPCVWAAVEDLAVRANVHESRRVPCQPGQQLPHAPLIDGWAPLHRRVGGRPPSVLRSPVAAKVVILSAVLLVYMPEVFVREAQRDLICRGQVVEDIEQDLERKDPKVSGAGIHSNVGWRRGAGWSAVAW